MRKDVHLGRKIQELRQQKEMSTYGLAKLVGISERYLRKIEAGHKPGIKTIVRIAAALEIEISELL